MALAFAVSIALGTVFSVPARAQGPDVQIVQLECNSDPELVVIENPGDAQQTFDGWTLQSDPSASQVFDLSLLSGLVPETKIVIQSGPSAAGVFLQDKWGLEFVFRDDDPTDYARIVDDTGAVVHQVNCGGAGPAATSTPTPAPTPEPPPINGVPNGGGPPPPPASVLSPAIIVLIGGSIAAAGVATIARAWLPFRHWPPELAPSSQKGSVGARGSAQRRRAKAPRRVPASGVAGLVLTGLLAATLMFLLVKHREA